MLVGVEKALATQSSHRLERVGAHGIGRRRARQVWEGITDIQEVLGSGRSLVSLVIVPVMFGKDVLSTFGGGIIQQAGERYTLEGRAQRQFRQVHDRGSDIDHAYKVVTRHAWGDMTGPANQQRCLDA